MNPYYIKGYNRGKRDAEAGREGYCYSQASDIEMLGYWDGYRSVV